MDFSRAKAQKHNINRQALQEKTHSEAIFKSDVAREQREKLKEQEDQRRRQSIAVRARIRENNREGVEKLRLKKIEEETGAEVLFSHDAESFKDYQTGVNAYS